MKLVFVPPIVIAGLGFILAAMMRGPIAQQRRLKSCQSNLKQIGLAINQYVRDYDEKFPMVTNWNEALAPYRNAPKQLNCTESLFGYSMNRYYSGLRMVLDQSPADNPLYFDSTVKQKNAFDTGTSWPIAGAHFRLKSYSWQQIGGSNVCYADGHVRWEQTKPKFQIIGPTYLPLPSVKKKVGNKSGARRVKL